VDVIGRELKAKDLLPVPGSDDKCFSNDPVW